MQVLQCTSLVISLSVQERSVLAYKENKQRFINHFTKDLEKIECVVDSAEQDIDVLIVQTTIASAQSKDTILVGDDTDLLVLLLHHADIDSNDIFLSPENTKASKASKTKKVWCINSARFYWAEIFVSICCLCMESWVVILQVISLDWAKDLW